MSSLSRNSCARTFGSCSSSKTFKPKKLPASLRNNKPLKALLNLQLVLITKNSMNFDLFDLTGMICFSTWFRCVTKSVEMIVLILVRFESTQQHTCQHSEIRNQDTVINAVAYHLPQTKCFTYTSAGEFFK